MKRARLGQLRVSRREWPGDGWGEANGNFSHFPVLPGASPGHGDKVSIKQFTGSLVGEGKEAYLPIVKCMLPTEDLAETSSGYDCVTPSVTPRKGVGARSLCVCSVTISLCLIGHLGVPNASCLLDDGETQPQLSPFSDRLMKGCE